MRRGEIAISVVIVIALGLLVLAILATMFVTRAAGVNEQVSDCVNTYRGQCVARTECTLRSGTVVEKVTCGEVTSYDFTDTYVQSFPSGGVVCCKS